jgi:hypothetical protein
MDVTEKIKAELGSGALAAWLPGNHSNQWVGGDILARGGLSS